MYKFAATFAVITGMIGLALITRADILYSLPIGVSSIVSSGVLLFVAIKSWENNVKSERIALLEDLSLKDIKNSVDTATDKLSAIAEAENMYTNQVIEKLFENHNTSLQANILLEQLTAIVQNELKTSSEQQAMASQATLEAILKVIDCFEERTAKTEKELITRLERLNETAHEFNGIIVEQVNGLHSMSSQANESLRLILTALQSEAKTFIEQQQSLYEIILEDIKETLTEFTETQLRNSEDTADSIKRTMSETNKALRELPLSLETFGIKNAETMRKSAEGFEQFERLINATLEQLTSISDKDYKLLKGMLK